MINDGLMKGIHEFKHEIKPGFSRLGFSENLLKTLVMLHTIFEDFVSISKQRCLLESCSTLSLETFGTNFSLILAMKRDLWLI